MKQKHTKKEETCLPSKVKRKSGTSENRLSKQKTKNVTSIARLMGFTVRSLEEKIINFPNICICHNLSSDVVLQKS